MGGLLSRTKTSNTQLSPKEEIAEDVPVLKHSLDFAWVTLATNDSYSLGALVLAHSLRIANTAHKLVVLITPVVSSSMREQLANVFDLVKVVDVLDSQDEAHLALLKRPELGVTFTKIHCWRLTEFQKCVFLDADTLVLKNCDELFEREELSAAPDVGWPDCFNTGVFVYKPSIETFNELIRFSVEQGSFDGGDQGLLNQFFRDWATKDIGKHLPFLYNLTSMAVYSYIPAFKHYESQIRIVHFIGSGKPWLQHMDPLTKTVTPTPGAEHLTSLLQMWWDIFREKVHPSLTKNLECARGMSNQETEACVNSITVETNNEIVSSSLIKPFTPYLDKDDSRQINLPYHPFDVKSSSGELLNITFLAEREQEMLRESGGENQFSNISLSAGRSCPDEQEDNLKSECPIIESPSFCEKLIQQPNEIEQKQCASDKNNLCHEEEQVLSATTEEVYLEEKDAENREDVPPNEEEEKAPDEMIPEQEIAEVEQSPFHYNAFFPDEACIRNYLEQNVSIYKPLGNENKNDDILHDKTIHDLKTEEYQEHSLPRFLTIAENDKRQSLNSYNGNINSHEKPSKHTETASAVEENVSSHQKERIRKTLSQENLNVSMQNVKVTCELQKSKSMSNLETNSVSVEEMSFWKSHPNLNSDPNRKYSMPKLKPLLPKQANKSFVKPNQSRPKITQYTEFHMSSDYKDVFDESYDKLGFVERQIMEQAQLRNGKSFTFPYLLAQNTSKKVNEDHLTSVQQNSIHDLADLSSCQRQKGNQPLSDITQTNNVRMENVCFLPVLKPLRPKKDENAFKKPKPKGKPAKERGTKSKMESRKAREKAKSQLEAKSKISNSHNVEEVLERLINFSKDYQNYFNDIMSENKKTNEGKPLTIRSDIFKKAHCLENNQSESNYSVRIYESPRLQYDKEFESGDAYFEDVQSRNVSDKRIAMSSKNTYGEVSGKNQCELKENRVFHYLEGSRTQYDQKREDEPSVDGVAAEGLPFRLGFMQPFKSPNTEILAVNTVENFWKNRTERKSPSENVNVKEKNVIAKESFGITENCNDRVEEGIQYKTGDETTHNASIDCGTGCTKGNDACNSNFSAVHNRETEMQTAFDRLSSKTSQKVDEKFTKVDGGRQMDSATWHETEAESKANAERTSPEIQVNALDGIDFIIRDERKSKKKEGPADDCHFNEVAQSLCRAEPTIASLSKRGHEICKAIGEIIQVSSEASKAERGTRSSETERRKTQTSERKYKKTGNETRSRKRGKTEGQKRGKSSKVFAFPLKNSSGDTLASETHEKSHSSKSVDAPFRSPKLTAHPENKTTQDSSKVDSLGSLEDFSRNNSGIAGAIAKLSLQSGGLTGAESEAASIVQEDYIRRQNWEMGTMDYMGRDSFDNIWSKICETLDGKWKACGLFHQLNLQNKIKISKDANLDVARNDEHLTASKPATSKDESRSVGMRASEGNKESEMNEFSRKATVNEKSDLQSVGKSVNITIPIDKISTNINKEQLRCDGKVEDITKETALNVSSLAGGNSGDQEKGEEPDVSSAFPKSVEALESFGKLFASGPLVLIPSIKTVADDNNEKRNESNIQELENKMKDSEIKCVGSVGDLFLGHAIEEGTAAIETVKDGETGKRQDSNSSEVPIDAAQMPKDIEKELNYIASEVAIQTQEPVEKKQDCIISEILADSTQTQKNDSRKGHDFVASKKLIYVARIPKDNEENEHDSGSSDALPRGILVVADDAQQLQDSAASEASSDTGQMPKAEAEIFSESSCEDLQGTESVEVNKQKKGVLNKLLELVGVGISARDAKSKNETSKSVFYDVEAISEDDPSKNESKMSTKKDSCRKSVFYDVETSTEVPTNGSESEPKTLESKTELSELQNNEKFMLSSPLKANESSDCKRASDSEKINQDYFGDVRTTCAAAEVAAGGCENGKGPKEKEKDSAFCEIYLGTTEKSKEESVSSDSKEKAPTELHAVQSECGVKFGSDFEYVEHNMAIKFQPIGKDNGIRDADIPDKHWEICKDSAPEERKNSVTPEEGGFRDLESIKTKIDGIIDEAKKVVQQLQEVPCETEDERGKNNALKTENKQFPVSVESPEISVKVFHSNEAEDAQRLPVNVEVHCASNEDREEEERKQDQTQELLSREKEALQAFGKIFVSGPVSIKPDVPESESSEQVTEPVSESDTNQTASSGVKNNKSEGEESRDEAKVNSSDRAILDRSLESRESKGVESETDAVHRIFRDIDGGKDIREKESSSVQASLGSERETHSETEPIYCNIEEVEEIRVTSEEDRKNRKPQSSKLTEQILKAIPPPRRKPFSDAKAEASTASSEASQMLASIPPLNVSILLDRTITEEMVVAEEEKKEEISSPVAPPVPPRRTRSKGRQPPLPPPKKKKK